MFIRSQNKGILADIKGCSIYIHTSSGDRLFGREPNKVSIETVGMQSPEARGEVLGVYPPDRAAEIMEIIQEEIEARQGIVYSLKSLLLGTKVFQMPEE